MSQPKRLALISEHASPLGRPGGVDSGGQNVYVAQVARRLAARGHTVEVLTRRDDPALPEVLEHERYRVVHVPAGPPTPVAKEALLPYMDAFSAYAIERARSQRYDLVHANFWMSALVATRMRETLGVPFTVTFHALGKVRRQYQGADDAFPLERLAIEERAVAAASRVIAECPQDELDLLALYEADPARLRMIPCGFDADECFPVPQLEARRALGLPGNVPIVLQLGRLVPRKGIDDALEGYARMRRQTGLDALFVVVGGETAEPDPVRTPELGRLQRLASDLGVLECCRFVGRADRDLLRYYYSTADVFVTMPWYEPFGITPVEAMACGTPVIGSRVGGIQHTVSDGETGYLVEPHDIGALAEALERVLTDHPLRARLGRAARARADAVFTWDSVVDSLERLYGEIAAEADEARAMPERSPTTSPEDGIIGGAFDNLVLALRASQLEAGTTLASMAATIARTFEDGGKLLVCGNGGSASDAQHFVAELVGRFREADRRPLPAIALGAESAFVTAWANDVSYESVFARQVEALAAPGDIVLGISTSGASPSVLRALEAATRRGARTMALLGRDGGAARALADDAIVVPAEDTQRIQEVHGLLIHLLAELIERRVTTSTALALQHGERVAR